MLVGRSLRAVKGGYLEGPGGRFRNNARMQGSSLASLRYGLSLASRVWPQSSLSGMASVWPPAAMASVLPLLGMA